MLFNASNKVRPSPDERATNSLATLPPAPGRGSIITLAFNDCANAAPIIRAEASAPPPADGVMIEIVRVEYAGDVCWSSWANACDDHTTRQSATAPLRRCV